MLAIRYNILESDWKRLLVKECWMGLRSTMSEIIERQIVPNAVDLARLFGPLESLGVGCDVSNALSHLRSAKRALLEAIHEREGRKQHQTLITEFWTGNGSLK